MATIMFIIDPILLFLRLSDLSNVNDTAMIIKPIITPKAKRNHASLNTLSLVYPGAP